MLNQSGNLDTTAANVSLGPVANVHITGGSSGQVLRTDGAGVLSFSNSIAGIQNYSNILTGVTGSNATGPQNIIGVGVTLSGSTVYQFQANFNLYKSAGTTNHTFSFLWGGTATTNKLLTNLLVQQSTIGYVTYNAARSVNQYTMENASAMIITSAITNTFYTINIQVSGIVSVNAGGTLIPQYSLSVAPGGAYTTSAGSNMSIWPIGSAGTTLSVGSWA